MEKHGKKRPDSLQDPLQKPQKGRTQGPEPQPHPQNRSDQSKTAEQSTARIDGKQQNAHKEGAAEDQVCHPRQTRPLPPQCPQHIVPQSQSGPHEKGRKKLRRLRRNRQLHQPKSLAKKPPVWAGVSS